MSQLDYVPTCLVLPELRRVLHLDLASLVDKVPVFLEEVDALLSVGRNVVVLVLKYAMDTLIKYGTLVKCITQI